MNCKNIDLRDNAYVDKMFCYYCQNRSTSTIENGKYIHRYGCPKCPRDKNLCEECGKTLFSPENINVYTPKIPTRYGYSYNHFPSQFPDVYYYGSFSLN